MKAWTVSASVTAIASDASRLRRGILVLPFPMRF